MSSGTCFGPRRPSAARIAFSKRTAWPVSRVGNRVAVSCGAVSVTRRVPRSALLAKATSIVPSTGTVTPVGVMLTATRVLSVVRPGQEMICGW